jgi:hypothetical protein
MWSDAKFERCTRIFDAELRRAFEHARTGATVEIPTVGVGTSLLQLPQGAPQIMKSAPDCSVVHKATSRAGWPTCSRVAV